MIFRLLWQAWMFLKVYLLSVWLLSIQLLSKRWKVKGTLTIILFLTLVFWGFGLFFTRRQQLYFVVMNGFHTRADFRTFRGAVPIRLVHTVLKSARGSTEIGVHLDSRCYFVIWNGCGLWEAEIGIFTQDRDRGTTEYPVALDRRDLAITNIHCF